jgi:hypothetical protein
MSDTKYVAPTDATANVLSIGGVCYTRGAESAEAVNVSSGSIQARLEDCCYGDTCDEPKFSTTEQPTLVIHFRDGDFDGTDIACTGTSFDPYIWPWATLPSGFSDARVFWEAEGIIIGDELYENCWWIICEADECEGLTLYVAGDMDAGLNKDGLPNKWVQIMPIGGCDAGTVTVSKS